MNLQPLEDAELLVALGAALASAPISPDAEELTALRAALSRGDGPPMVTLRSPVPTGHPLRHAAFVAAAVVALVVVGGVGALSTGTPVPSALRAPVRALGFPVESPELGDARSAMATLRQVLAQGDDAKVEAARDELTRRLDRLGRDDRATIDTDARGLLRVAATRLQPPVISDAPGAVGEPGTTVAPPAVESAAPADDSGSGSSAPPASPTTLETGGRPDESPAAPSRTDTAVENEPPSP